MRHFGMRISFNMRLWTLDIRNSLCANTSARQSVLRTKKAGPFSRGPALCANSDWNRGLRGEGPAIGQKLAAERAAAQAAHASFRGRSDFRNNVGRNSLFDHFHTVAAMITVAAVAAVICVAAMATTMAAAMAMTVATTMATAVAAAMATTGEQTAVAAVAAAVTGAVSTAITVATAVASATAAVTRDRLAGPAHQGQAHHRAEHRDAENQCTIHPRILQKQQVPYRKGYWNASAVRDAFRSPYPDDQLNGEDHLIPIQPPHARPILVWRFAFED